MNCGYVFTLLERVEGSRDSGGSASVRKRVRGDSEKRLHTTKKKEWKMVK
jgi:hypothetical protein